jgi:GAF domain-containing protein
MESDATRLNNIVITPQLLARTGRAPNRQAEREGFDRLAHETSEGKVAILNALCQLALRLCQAGSSGVSMLRADQEGEYFSWDVLEGRFAPFVGGRAPRYDSPCGYCLERGSAQLYSHPERYFNWLGAPGIPIVEGLVIPIYKGGQQAFGTIWIMSHDASHHFDREDLRVMSILAAHTSAALRLQETS